MTDHIDLLRIIARDGGRLNNADRAEIAAAADEFERTQRALVATQAALIEANAHRIALAEQVSEDRRKQFAKSLSMSSGWCKVTGYSLPTSGK